MTPWQWWASSACGRDDGEWELGEFDSRETAVAAGNLEYTTGEPFYVIEARTSTLAKYATGNHEIVPFVKTRNEERLVASVDTHPKDGNSTQIEVPLVSGAVPSGASADAPPSGPSLQTPQGGDS